MEKQTPDFGAYAPVFPNSRHAQFDSPRKFWQTNPLGGQATGLGIAEFTNRSFISQGTNFDKRTINTLPSIDPANVEEVDVKSLCATNPGTCGTASLTGTVRFFGNAITDANTGETLVNRRMTTSSVFDAALSRRVLGPVFSYNKFNADAAAEILVPRAVGYSAGMINYFFRGEMDLKEDLANLGKFAVKNGSNERMGGTLSLHYDLEDGQRNRVAEFDVNVNPQAEAAVTIPVSDIKEMPDRVDNEAYMMVFKGTLGEEKPDGASPGAVVGTQIRIRNVFDIYDTLYRPESNYPKGYMWFWFDWEGEGRLELKKALISALIDSRVAVNGHRLSGGGDETYGALGYVATNNFYAQMEVSARTDRRNGENYLYIQNVDPSGLVEVTVDGRVIASFNWQSNNGRRFTVTKPFRVFQR